MSTVVKCALIRCAYNKSGTCKRGQIEMAAHLFDSKNLFYPNDGSYVSCESYEEKACVCRTR